MAKQAISSIEAKAERVFFGKRDAMIGEVGAAHFVGGKYLVMIDGPAQWDTEGFDTLADARKEAKATAEHFGVPAVRVQ